MASKLTNTLDLTSKINGRSAQENLNLGQVVCLGLDEIRETLGDDRWKKAENLVTKYLEEALTAFLDKDDSYMKARDGSCVIVFGATCEEIAAQKSVKISEYVNRKMFGEEGLAGLSISGVVSTERGLMPGEKRNATDVIANLAEMSMQQSSEPRPERQVVSESPAVKPETSARKPVQAAMEAAPEPYGPDGNAATYTGVKNKLDMSSEFDAEGLLQRLTGLPDQQISYGFYPVLDVDNERVDRFVCVPVKTDPFDGSHSIGYDVLDPDCGVEDITALDLSIFEKCMEVHTQCLTKGWILYSGFYLHFETLSNRHARDQILHFLERVPVSVRNTIMPIITDVPAGISESRLHELLKPLVKQCRDVLVRLDPRDYGARLGTQTRRFSGVGIRRVVVELPDKLNATDHSWLMALERGKAFEKMNWTISNASTVKTTHRLIELGAKYAFGPIIGGPFETVSAPYRLPLKQITSASNMALAYSKSGGYQKSRFSALADHFDITFSVTQPDAGGVPVFRYLSSGIEKLTGYSVDELNGKPVRIMKPDGVDRTRAHRFFERLKKTGESTVVLKNQTKRGQVFSNRITAIKPPASHNQPEGTYYAFMENAELTDLAVPRQPVTVAAD